MARTADWWSTHDVGTGYGLSGARDLLSGSGLNVAGATVLRCLGAFQYAEAPTEFTPSAGMTYGLRIGATAAATDLDPANINTHDWLWLQSSQFYEYRTTDRPMVGSDSRDGAFRWDADTSRVLAAGETLWLVYQVQGAFAAVDRARLFTRALVLAPA